MGKEEKSVKALVMVFIHIFLMNCKSLIPFHEKKQKNSRNEMALNKTIKINKCKPKENQKLEIILSNIRWGKKRKLLIKNSERIVKRSAFTGYMFH